jgi:hypothetical protein
MKKLSLAFAAVTMLGLGCGGEDGGIDSGPSAMEGTANPAAMTSAAVQAGALRTALESKNGAGIASAALGLSGAGTASVSPRAPGAALTVQDMVNQMQTNAVMTVGNVSCTETGCTFDKYGVSGSNMLTISGSINATDAGNGAKKVVWSLTGSGTFSGVQGSTASNLSFSYQWKGDITVSATSVSGAAGSTWSGSGEVNGQSLEYAFGSYLKLDNITFTSQMPTGGSIYAKMWITASVGGNTQSEAFQATHKFGI